MGGSINLPFGKNLLSGTCRDLESALKSELFPQTSETEDLGKGVRVRVFVAPRGTTRGWTSTFRFFEL